MIAQYPGACSDCGGHFPEGTDIERTEAGWKHRVCPDDPSVALRPNEEVCTDCWLVKPCGC